SRPRTLPCARGFRTGSRFAAIAVPEAERDAERAARVACRRLDPDLIEDALAQDAAVADAIERDAACQTEIAQSGLALREARHLDHHLFGDLLNRARQVHFALRQLRLGGARRSAKQLRELLPGHRQGVWIGEVLHVHPQAAVVTDLDEMILDGLHVAR